MVATWTAYVLRIAFGMKLMDVVWIPHCFHTDVFFRMVVVWISHGLHMEDVWFSLCVLVSMVYYKNMS